MPGGTPIPPVCPPLEHPLAFALAVQIDATISGGMREPLQYGDTKPGLVVTFAVKPVAVYPAIVVISPRSGFNLYPLGFDPAACVVGLSPSTPISQ